MRAYNQAEAELLAEIRQLGNEMIRYDAWIARAVQYQHFDQVEELLYQREMTQLRRSVVMRQLWAGRVVVSA
jgi:hypothetical protein